MLTNNRILSAMISLFEIHRFVCAAQFEMIAMMAMIMPLLVQAKSDGRIFRLLNFIAEIFPII